MGARLFKHNVRVTIYRVDGQGFTPTSLANGVEIEGLRIQVAIEKHRGSDPDTCLVTISNLSPETRSALQHRPLAVLVQGGFDGEFKHLFTGDVRQSPTYHRPPNVETEIQLGDGDRAYRHARVNRSFRPGSRVVDAVRDAAREMGLKLPADVEASQDLQEQFATGETLVGPARDELTRLLSPYGMRWAIQAGRLIILRAGETRPGEALPVDKSTGLTGTPTWNQPSKKGQAPTLALQTLLYPEVLPNSLIRVRSLEVNGTFRVERVGHSIDSHGETAQTDIQAKPYP